MRFLLLLVIMGRTAAGIIVVVVVVVVIIIIVTLTLLVVGVVETDPCQGRQYVMAHHVATLEGLGTRTLYQFLLYTIAPSCLDAKYSLGILEWLSQSFESSRYCTIASRRNG